MSKSIDQMILSELEEELKDLSRTQLILMIQSREQRILNMTECMKTFVRMVDELNMNED